MSIIRNEIKLREAVQKSLCVRNVLELLGLRPTGGNYDTFRKAVKDFSIDVSHFTGKGYLKGKTHKYSTRPLKDVLIVDKVENTWRLKQRLIKDGLKECVCENCGLTEWCGNSIPLELHHKYGNKTNNTLANIQLLCPNCHVFTDNYRGKKKKRVETKWQRPTGDN